MELRQAAGRQVLLAGWGKPHEWSGLDECPLHLSVSRAGLVTVVAGKQTLGTAQLAAPKDEAYQLSFTSAQQRVVLRSARGEVSLPLPAGFAGSAGYFMLRLEGLAGQHGEEWLRLRRVEIDHTGQHAPLTAEERHQEIQAWAKERLDKNWAILDRFRAQIAADTSAGRWGYKTDLAVRPGLIKTGEKVTVEFRVAGPIPSPCTARVEPDFLSATPGAPQALSLNWKTADNGDHLARVELTPQRPGNWRVVWQAGTEQLSRVLAVAEPGYTVCRMLLTAEPGPWIPNHEPEAYDVIHQYGLAADYWGSDEWVSPFSRTPEEPAGPLPILLSREPFVGRPRDAAA